MRTPSDLENILTAIRSILVDTHTAAPGIIRSYDPAKRKAEVQHAIKREYKQTGIQPLNPIAGVPVWFPGGAGIEISWALEEGDEVLLVFAERALDLWLQRGGVVDPHEYRMHDLSDAIAIPGLQSFKRATEASSDGLLIRQPDSGTEIRVLANGAVEVETEASTMSIKADGAIKANNTAGAYVSLGTAGGADIGNATGSLVDLVSSLTQAVQTATVPTMIGPQVPINPQFAAIIAQATAIKGDA